MVFRITITSRKMTLCVCSVNSDTSMYDVEKLINIFLIDNY